MGKPLPDYQRPEHRKQSIHVEKSHNSYTASYLSYETITQYVD